MTFILLALLTLVLGLAVGITAGWLMGFKEQILDLLPWVKKVEVPETKKSFYDEIAEKKEQEAKEDIPPAEPMAETIKEGMDELDGDTPKFDLSAFEEK